LANCAATLIRNANLPGIGWRRGNLIKARNGRIKPGVMHYNGQEYAAPNGTCQIRSYDGAKAIYTTVGDDLDKAEATLARLLEKMEFYTLNAKFGIKTPEPEAEKKTLAQCASEYIAKKKSPSLGPTYS
jgi:hypothetical protein